MSAPRIPHGESGRGDAPAKGANETPGPDVTSLPGPNPAMTRGEVEAEAWSHYDGEPAFVEAALSIFDEDRTARCKHLRIETYRNDAQGLGLWACRDCKRRFYPAERPRRSKP